MRFKIGLKSNENVKNFHQPTSRSSEIAVVHRRILSGPNPILSCKDMSDVNCSNSFTQDPGFTPQLGQQKTGSHVKSSTQIMIQRIENDNESSDLRLMRSSVDSNDHFKRHMLNRSHIENPKNTSPSKMKQQK